MANDQTIMVGTCKEGRATICLRLPTDALPSEVNAMTALAYERQGELRAAIIQIESAAMLRRAATNTGE